MNIKIENTPNPNTLKFIPGVEVLKQHMIRNFSNKDDLNESTLAQQLFDIKGITNVFFGQYFISITKSAEEKWEEIQTPILAKLVDHFLSENPVLNTQQIDIKKENDKLDIEKQIIELLNTRIRPAVAQDGGDIIYNRFEDGVLYLELHGACRGCPSSAITLKQGIENMVKHFIPEVQSVESI